MEGLKIVGMCVILAIVYGILHDLVTANICVEYFSVYHPKVVDTRSPWLLALVWGVLASWWMGLFLGSLIAAAGRAGPLPKFRWHDLLLPLLAVICTSYLAALVAGVTGFFLIVDIPDWAMTRHLYDAHLSPEKQRAFTTDLYAHNASYIASTVCAFILCAWVIWARIRAGRQMYMSAPPLAP